MVEIELCRSLRAFIEDAVKDLYLPCAAEDDKASDWEYESRRVPRVINGYLPQKRSEAEDDFPFIVVRPDEATSTRESTSVTVSIIFGAYSESPDGYEHCLNMVSRVRTALMAMPFLRLDDRYILEDELSWSNFSEQAWPYWQVDMTTKWTFISPQPVSGVEDL